MFRKYAYDWKKEAKQLKQKYTKRSQQKIKMNWNVMTKLVRLSLYSEKHKCIWIETKFDNNSIISNL